MASGLMSLSIQNNILYFNVSYCRTCFSSGVTKAWMDSGLTLLVRHKKVLVLLFLFLHNVLWIWCDKGVFGFIIDATCSSLQVIVVFLLLQNVLRFWCDKGAGGFRFAKTKACTFVSLTAERVLVLV